MIKKRLIGVITVRQGWAVQSFGYGRYLPLGKPEVLVENLDRWGVDEILIQCIDRTRAGLGPDFELLNSIGKRGYSTPLLYAGGIRHAQDAVDAVQAAADRVVVDALLRESLDEIARAASRLGNQAIIGAIPVSAGPAGLSWLDYRDKQTGPFPESVIDAFQSGLLSEALVIDWRNEGRPNAFDMSLIEALPSGFPVILFGGISCADQLTRAFAVPRVAAAAVGNFLAYREHAVQALKGAMIGTPIRPPVYQQTQYHRAP